MDLGIVLRSVWRSAGRGGVKQVLRRLPGNLRDSIVLWPAIIRRKRSRHVTFIGVTGSCGKTTTTRLVGAVLSSAGQCCIGAGNNSHQAVIEKRPFCQCVYQILRSGGLWELPGRIATHFWVLQPRLESSPPLAATTTRTIGV